jgi:hypothetical protein
MAFMAVIRMLGSRRYDQTVIPRFSTQVEDAPTMS